MAEQGQVGANVRFIDRFLRKSHGRLTGLLLGQLDAFNRIATTFGAEASSRFCTNYIEGLRAVLPGGTPIIRVGERRFVVLLASDSVNAVMDTAAQLAEDERAQMKVGSDTFIVDLTLGIAVFPTHADDGASLLRRAELAFAEARANESAFAMYTPDATRRQATLWKLESDLGNAVQRRELEGSLSAQDRSR